MAIPYITIGCPTTGGGKVITGQNSFLVEGIAIACVGDKVTCPLHKTTATIISGDPYMQVMGKSVARVNDSLSCGCKLLPKQSLVVGATGASIAEASNLKSNYTNNITDNNQNKSATFYFFNEITKEPISDFFYTITLPDGNKIEGFTDKQGKTDLTKIGVSPDNVQIETFDLSKPMEEWK